MQYEHCSSGLICLTLASWEDENVCSDEYVRPAGQYTTSRHMDAGFLHFERRLSRRIPGSHLVNRLRGLHPGTDASSGFEHSAQHLKKMRIATTDDTDPFYNSGGFPDWTAGTESRTNIIVDYRLLAETRAHAHQRTCQFKGAPANSVLARDRDKGWRQVVQPRPGGTGARLIKTYLPTELVSDDTFLGKRERRIRFFLLLLWCARWFCLSEN